MHQDYRVGKRTILVDIWVFAQSKIIILCPISYRAFCDIQFIRFILF